MTPALQRFIETRDRRVQATSGLGWNKAAITEQFTKLMAGQVVRIGGRASCGGKVDPTWVEFTAWNEVIKKARASGITISDTPVKHGNGWATKCGGFWDERDYCLSSRQLLVDDCNAAAEVQS